LCDVTVPQTQSKHLFTNDWYAKVVAKIMAHYKEKKKKIWKTTFRKKIDYVTFLARVALEEENVEWKKGLPSS
jgi:hypothetical protein